MPNQVKKLLILCGNVLHVKVVEAAKEMGIYTIVTDNLPLEKAPAKQIADEALYINVLDVDALVEYCRKNHVDGVINFCVDVGQRPQQQICERLGLPCYGTKEQYFALTDKNAFKAMCVKNGIDVIPQFSEEDTKNGKIEYPVLVKPVDSRGSRGQAVCHNDEELAAALEVAKKESSNGQAIIEKYMDGKQDYTVTYIFKDGEPHLISSGSRYLGKKEDGLDKQLVGAIVPSMYTDFYLEKVHDRVVKGLKSLGIKNGPVFMQGFIDGDTVRFYDPGCRFPGSEYAKILTKSTGMNVIKSLISFLLGGAVDDYNGKLKEAYKLGGKISPQLYVTVRGGTIGTFDGLEEIKSHPDVIAVSQRYFVGDTVPQTGDVKQRVCEIGMLTDKDNVKDLMKWVQSKLVILDENGENMLVSQFDPEILG